MFPVDEKSEFSLGVSSPKGTFRIVSLCAFKKHVCLNLDCGADLSRARFVFFQVIDLSTS